MRKEARAGYGVALQEGNAWIAGELAYWHWKADAAVPAPDWVADPFSFQMAGDWRRAAVAWRDLRCPYEEARALAEGDADARREAFQMFRRIGAHRTARKLAHSMRAGGVDHVPRGPYAGARANPFGLTPRQTDVLVLLAEDLTNLAIAERLAISPKTVDHHLAAVFAKLEVHSRQAAAAVARRSLISPRRA
jgi:DNA-binding CsgD family transcriptional regulator